MSLSVSLVYLTAVTITVCTHMYFHFKVNVFLVLPELAISVLKGVVFAMCQRFYRI